jgi:hypothetical protein
MIVLNLVHSVCAHSALQVIKKVSSITHSNFELKGKICETKECDETNPCRNNGICLKNSSSEFGVTCVCPQKYNGIFCESLSIDLII